MDEWRRSILDEISELNQEIELKANEVKNLRERRNKLQKKLYDGRTGELRGMDTHLVPSSEIRPLIKEWIDLYDYQFKQGGQLMLAERSEVSTRTIRAIVNKQRKFVSLQTADRLLQAAEMARRVEDLTIIPVKSDKAIPPEPPPTLYVEE